MINVYDHGEGEGAVRFEASISIQVAPHWKVEYGAYGPTMQKATKDVRMQIKKLRHALRCADLTTNF